MSLGRWSYQDRDTLIELVKIRRLSNTEIALRMRRSESAINSAISHYASRTSQEQRRLCLPCRQPFIPKHRHNWICGSCLQNDELFACA